MIEVPKFHPKKNNFDISRLLLAVVVVFQHLSLLTQFKEFKMFPVITFWIQPVEGFFVISGFLIAISYLKSKSFIDYLEKRARRILPAYIFVIITCTIAGIFFTNKNPTEYFSLNLIKYLFANLTFLNFLQPSLPSVFASNPYTTAINGSLWTIKIEVMFYIALPVIFYTMRRFSNLLILILTYIASLTYFLVLTHLSDVFNKPILDEVARQLPGYLSYFISAIIICLYYQFFKDKKNILICIALPLYILGKFTGFIFVIPICQAVIVLYFCLFFPYFGNWGKYGDFSYGIYIWHFPLIQALFSCSLFNNKPIIFMILTILLTVTFGFISWHYVEKPALRKSSHYYTALNAKR